MGDAANTANDGGGEAGDCCGAPPTCTRSLAERHIATLASEPAGPRVWRMNRSVWAPGRGVNGGPPGARGVGWRGACRRHRTGGEAHEGGARLALRIFPRRRWFLMIAGGVTPRHLLGSRPSSFCTMLGVPGIGSSSGGREGARATHATAPPFERELGLGRRSMQLQKGIGGEQNREALGVGKEAAGGWGSAVSAARPSQGAGDPSSVLPPAPAGSAA